MFSSSLISAVQRRVLGALQVLVPSEADEGSGQLVLNVELTPMCYKESRYSRSSELAACCAEQVNFAATSLQSCTLLLPGAYNSHLSVMSGER